MTMGGNTPMRDDRPVTFPRGHRRPGWVLPAVLAVAYVAGFGLAHALRPQLPGLTVACYAVAEVFGLLFLARYARTDWRAHPWGRHVMAFMVCLEVLFTLALSRRIFGDWAGLEEMLFLASATFAWIVGWRWWLQRTGGRRAAHRSIDE